MKKYFSICLFFSLIFASLSLTGCGDDDNNQDVIESSIIGKWHLVSVMPQEMAVDYDECEFQGYVEFESDGTYSDHRPCGVSDIGGGKWKLSGNNLEITSDILPIPIKASVEINDNTLVITQNAFYFNNEWEQVDCILRETYKRVQ